MPSPTSANGDVFPTNGRLLIKAWRAESGNTPDARERRLWNKKCSHPNETASSEAQQNHDGEICQNELVLPLCFFSPEGLLLS